MTEHKLFEGKVPYVSTEAFHHHRSRAPHLEQDSHKARLNQAIEYVYKAADLLQMPVTVSDLGCGDGGLLSQVQKSDLVRQAWGYDFQPSNQEGWQERGVEGYLKDAFGKDKYTVKYGNVTVTTEVLEHLADPHGTLKRIAKKTSYLVASSPYDENAVHFDECHAWAWDKEGYRDLIENAGFTVLEHIELAWKFQVLLAVSNAS